MTIQSLIGLSGVSFLLSVSLMPILITLGLRKRMVYIISLVFFCVSFLSISGYSINLYVRGLINDLSISTLVVLGYYFITLDTSKSQSSPLLIIIVVSGFFLYPAALGLGPIDPYAWGYINKHHGLLAPLVFLALLGSLMCFAFIKKDTLLLVCLSVSTLSFQAGLLESKNLWDYLLDPILFFYALFTVFSRILSRNADFRQSRGGLEAPKKMTKLNI